MFLVRVHCYRLTITKMTATCSQPCGSFVLPQWCNVWFCYNKLLNMLVGCFAVLRRCFHRALDMVNSRHLGWTKI